MDFQNKMCSTAGDDELSVRKHHLVFLHGSDQSHCCTVAPLVLISSPVSAALRQIISDPSLVRSSHAAPSWAQLPVTYLTDEGSCRQGKTMNT